MNQLKNPPMAVALLALFVALTGTSYAAIALPKNSVGSPQIKKNSVTASKVKDGSLKAVDFGAGQVPAGQTGPTGSVGSAGPKGDSGAPGTAGAKGEPGVKGAVSTVVVHRKDYTLADGVNSDTLSDDLQDVECAAGEKLISGGGNFAPLTHGDARFTGSGPRSGTAAAPTVLADGQTPTNWRVTAANPAGGDATTVTVRVFVICAT